MRPGVRLGVDVGSVRVGCRGGDPSGLLATPVETLARDLERRRRPAGRGRPGASSATRSRCRRAAAFAVRRRGPGRRRRPRLRRAAGRPGRSGAGPPGRRAAQHRQRAPGRCAGRASGSGRAARVVDQVAAVVILQHALDTERSSGRPPGEPVEPPVGPPPAHPDGRPGGPPGDRPVVPVVPGDRAAPPGGAAGWGGLAASLAGCTARLVTLGVADRRSLARLADRVDHDTRGFAGAADPGRLAGAWPPGWTGPCYGPVTAASRRRTGCTTHAGTRSLPAAVVRAEGAGGRCRGACASPRAMRSGSPPGVADTPISGRPSVAGGLVVDPRSLRSVAYDASTGIATHRRGCPADGRLHRPRRAWPRAAGWHLPVGRAGRAGPGRGFRRVRPYPRTDVRRDR